MNSTSPVSSMRLEPKRRRRKPELPKQQMGLMKARWHFKSDWVASHFRQFGEHCARNQIRVLLIDCFVMTNLFYPALTLYLTKRSQPPPDSKSPPARDGTFSLLSQPLLTSFFPYPPPLLPRLQIEQGRWWESAAVTTSPSSSSWIANKLTPSQRLKGKMRAVEHEVVVLRVAWTTVGRVLDGVQDDMLGKDAEMVQMVRSLADDWGSLDETQSDEGCVRESWREEGATCLTIPLGDEYTEDGLYRTMSVLMLSSGVQENLADRWRRKLATRTSDLGAEIFTESHDFTSMREHESQVWSLSLNSTSSPLASIGTTTTTPPSFILALYAILILTLLRQLSAATKVHSRFGLAFTGVMELACSTVMSFSILGLLGWADVGVGAGTGTGTERGLPVYMMPFVIVIVGVENMSTLTKAVFSVPFSYSVPDRIGLALAKVGATLTLTSLADMALLAIVGFFIKIRAVREFCLFAGIVTFVDWWMLHTFFLTVLSIDAQRLELADVLQAPDLPAKPLDNKVASGQNKTITEGSLKSIGTGFKAVVMGRTARGFSLILLLVFLSGLLYVTDSSRPNSMSTANLYGYWPSASSSGSATMTTLASTATAQDIAAMSPSEQIWRGVNPTLQTTINVVIPPAAIVVLPTEGHVMQPADLRKLSLPHSRLSFPRVKPLFSFIKIFILPQALTAGSLYLLLLYLLKDADLLDAQRHRLGRGEVTGMQLVQRQVDSTLEMRFNLHPPEHQADIELLASSDNGEVVVSVDFDSSIRLWRAGIDDTIEAFCEILMAPGLASAGNDPVTHLAIDTKGSFVVVATSSGQLFAWRSAVGTAPEAVALASLAGHSGRVSGIALLENTTPQDDPFVETGSALGPTIAVAMSDGSAFEVQGQEVRGVITAGVETAEIVFLLRYKDKSRILVSTQDVTVAWRRSSQGNWEVECRMEMRPPTAVVVASVHHDMPWTLYAAGFSNGSVVIFDGSSGEMLESSQADEVIDGLIVKMEIASPASSHCTGCGLLSTADLHLIASTRHHVHIHKITLRSEVVFYKCTHSAPRSQSNGIGSSLLSPSGHVSRSDANLVLPPSPLRARKASSASQQQLVPPSQPNFPVSGHGHTRRLSAMHREGEDDSVTSTRNPIPHNSSADLTSMTESEASSPKLSDISLESLGAIASTKGDWALVDDRSLIGVRRCGRSAAHSEAEWQLWRVDLASAWDGYRLHAESVAISSLSAQHIESVRNSVEVAGDDGPEVSLRHRRAQRLQSLSGSPNVRITGRLSSAPLARPPALSYHRIWPVVQRGQGIVAGFGNRIGVAIFPLAKVSSHSTSPGFSARNNGQSYPFPSSPSSLPPPPLASSSRRASINYSLAIPTKSKQL